MLNEDKALAIKQDLRNADGLKLPVQQVVDKHKVSVYDIQQAIPDIILMPHGILVGLSPRDRIDYLS